MNYQKIDPSIRLIMYFSIPIIIWLLATKEFDNKSIIGLAVLIGFFYLAYRCVDIIWYAINDIPMQDYLSDNLTYDCEDQQTADNHDERVL